MENRCWYTIITTVLLYAMGTLMCGASGVLESLCFWHGSPIYIGSTCLLRLKDHFAFKKKRKSPEQSYFSPGDAIGILASPMEEQLLAPKCSCAGFTMFHRGDIRDRIMTLFGRKGFKVVWKSMSTGCLAFGTPAFHSISWSFDPQTLGGMEAPLKLPLNDKIYALIHGFGRCEAVDIIFIGCRWLHCIDINIYIYIIIRTPSSTESMPG